MSKMRVMLVDDSPIFLEGLCTVLEYSGGETEIAGSVTDPLEAAEVFESTLPDVVLLDIKMPGKSGVDVARELIGKRPDTKIIMLTTFDDFDLIVDAMEAGAKGYFLKDAPADQIVDAVKAVHRGSVLMSADVARKLASRPPSAQSGVLQEAPEPASDERVLALRDLSVRERAILRGIGEGKSNQEIADELFISDKTVRNYVSHIYDILSFSRRGKAVVWAREHRQLLRE